jgi:hypothetical protein
MRGHGSFLSALLSDRRGNVGMIFGLAAIPLIGAAGLAVDYSRASQVRAELQEAVDAAALAGAAQVDEANIAATIESMIAGNPGAADFGENIAHSMSITSNSIIVSAAADVASTIGKALFGSYHVTVSAEAHRGPAVRKVEFSVDHFNSSAWDANAVYWYIVPEDGGVPDEDDMQLLLSNDPANPGPQLPVAMTIGLNEEIGFALVNTTGGVRSYGNNSYGQPPGSVHAFYSHLSPENLRLSGAASCADGTVHHEWDDNGGGADDNDFDDATYDFACTTVVIEPATVYLMH